MVWLGTGMINRTLIKRARGHCFRFGNSGLKKFGESMSLHSVGIQNMMTFLPLAMARMTLWSKAQVCVSERERERWVWICVCVLQLAVAVEGGLGCVIYIFIYIYICTRRGSTCRGKGGCRKISPRVHSRGGKKVQMYLRSANIVCYCFKSHRWVLHIETHEVHAAFSKNFRDFRRADAVPGANWGRVRIGVVTGVMRRWWHTAAL